MKTLVILPTYEEAENIEEVLRRVRLAVPTADALVVDDGSPDGTADLAERWGREHGGVAVLRRSGKQGLGSAYRAGFALGLAEGYDAMVEMDSDLQHDPAMLPALLHVVEDGAELAIGSRYVPGGSVPGWTWSRRFISRAGNRYASAVLGLAIRDATAGFRAYSAAALDAADIDTVRADGYGFQVEMAYRVSRGGGRIVEVPIVFADRVRGDSKMSWHIVGEALRLVTWWGLRDRVLRPMAATLARWRR
ncbi:MAG: polyprenol monophosphomannose synthase [Acidimicrobiia bacterium]|nr:polyprenol monophosphomannose synthase [Acidimicrobiia bacterium]